MHRRNFPSILLYGFGLALILSLAYNGFLLYQQSQLRIYNELDPVCSTHSVERVDWQQQLAECQRANQVKDSLIRRLEQAPNAPPAKPVATQPKPPKN